MKIQRRVAIAATASTVLAACGGGSDPTAAPQIDREIPLTPGTGGTGGRMEQGAVTGFGSIFIAGVRLDDSDAVVDIEGAGSAELGMIASCVTEQSASGLRATSVRSRPVLVGPLTLSGSVASVNGIAFATSARTAFAGADGMAALRAGEWVEVHGFVHDAGVLATRVAKLSQASATRILVGTLSARGSSSTISAGGASLAWSGPTDELGGNGAIVRVRASFDGNHFQAVSVEALAAAVADDWQVSRQGIWSGGNSRNFEIDGQRVFLNPSVAVNTAAGPWIAGALVRVSGVMHQGVLRANAVTVQAADAYIVAGSVTGKSGSSLRVQRQAIAVTSLTEYANGSPTDLKNGKRVTVLGTTVANGVLVASSVTFA